MFGFFKRNKSERILQNRDLAEIISVYKYIIYIYERAEEEGARTEEEDITEAVGGGRCVDAQDFRCLRVVVVVVGY